MSVRERDGTKEGHIFPTAENFRPGLGVRFQQKPTDNINIIRTYIVCMASCNVYTYVCAEWCIYTEVEQLLLRLRLTCAGIVVDIEGEGTDDVPEPLLQVTVRKTLPEGVVEHLQVGAERVLVHGVDGCQVREDKE